MKRPSFDFHPAASDEAEEAYGRYAERSTIAAARFLEELDSAIARIQAYPEIGGSYLHGTRCWLMRRFPYLVVYKLTDEAVLVVALAHGRRRPGYWKTRVK
jgi:plasmid stabilization system protein ParE